MTDPQPKRCVCCGEIATQTDARVAAAEALLKEDPSLQKEERK